MRSYPMPTDPSASATLSLPLLPLRDVVLFPGIDTTLFLGRASTRRAAATAIGGDGRIAAVTQRSGQVETVTRADLHDIGVMASVKSMVRLPDGNLKVVVYGMQRIHVHGVSDGALYQELHADPVEELVTAVPGDSQELLEAVAAQGPPAPRDASGCDLRVAPATGKRRIRGGQDCGACTGPVTRLAAAAAVGARPLAAAPAVARRRPGECQCRRRSA